MPGLRRIVQVLEGSQNMVHRSERRGVVVDRVIRACSSNSLPKTRPLPGWLVTTNTTSKQTHGGTRAAQRANVVYA